MKVQHIAIEGKCFFINTDMIIRRSSYPSDLQEYNILCIGSDKIGHDFRNFLKLFFEV